MKLTRSKFGNTPILNASDVQQQQQRQSAGPGPGPFRNGFDRLAATTTALSLSPPSSSMNFRPQAPTLQSGGVVSPNLAGSSDLAGVYVRKCLKFSLTVNKELRARLTLLDRSSAVTTFDFNTVPIDNSFESLIEVLLLAANVKSIDAQGTKMKDEHVDMLVHQLSRNVGIKEINLSGNPAITDHGGRMLLDWANTRRHITNIQVEGTSICPALQEEILLAVDENLAAASNATSDGGGGGHHSNNFLLASGAAGGGGAGGGGNMGMTHLGGTNRLLQGSGQFSGLTSPRQWVPNGSFALMHGTAGAPRLTHGGGNVRERGGMASSNKNPNPPNNHHRRTSLGAQGRIVSSDSLTSPSSSYLVPVATAGGQPQSADVLRLQDATSRVAQHTALLCLVFLRMVERSLRVLCWENTSRSFGVLVVGVVAFFVETSFSVWIVLATAMFLQKRYRIGNSSPSSFVDAEGNRLTIANAGKVGSLHHALRTVRHLQSLLVSLHHSQSGGGEQNQSTQQPDRNGGGRAHGDIQQRQEEALHTLDEIIQLAVEGLNHYTAGSGRRRLIQLGSIIPVLCAFVSMFTVLGVVFCLAMAWHPVLGKMQHQAPQLRQRLVEMLGGTMLAQAAADTQQQLTTSSSSSTQQQQQQRLALRTTQDGHLAVPRGVGGGGSNTNNNVCVPSGGGGNVSPASSSLSGFWSNNRYNNNNNGIGPDELSSGNNEGFQSPFPFVVKVQRLIDIDSAHLSAKGFVPMVQVKYNRKSWVTHKVREPWDWDAESGVFCFLPGCTKLTFVLYDDATEIVGAVSEGTLILDDSVNIDEQLVVPLHKAQQESSLLRTLVDDVVGHERRNHAKHNQIMGGHGGNVKGGGGSGGGVGGSIAALFGGDSSAPGRPGSLIVTIKKAYGGETGVAVERGTSSSSRVATSKPHAPTVVAANTCVNTANRTRTSNTIDGRPRPTTTESQPPPALSVARNLSHTMEPVDEKENKTKVVGGGGGTLNGEDLPKVNIAVTPASPSLQSKDKDGLPTPTLPATTTAATTSQGLPPLPPAHNKKDLAASPPPPPPPHVTRDAGSTRSFTIDASLRGQLVETPRPSSNSRDPTPPQGTAVSAAGVAAPTLGGRGGGGGSSAVVVARSGSNITAARGGGAINGFQPHPAGQSYSPSPVQPESIVVDRSSSIGSAAESGTAQSSLASESCSVRTSQSTSGVTFTAKGGGSIKRRRPAPIV